MDTIYLTKFLQYSYTWYGSFLKTIFNAQWECYKVKKKNAEKVIITIKIYLTPDSRHQSLYKYSSREKNKNKTKQNPIVLLQFFSFYVFVIGKK